MYFCKRQGCFFIHKLFIYRISKYSLRECSSSHGEVHMPRTTTTVSIDSELKQKAKALNISLSRVLEEALRERTDIDSLREERERLDELIKRAERRKAEREERTKRKLQAVKQGYERARKRMNSSEREEWLESRAEELGMRPKELLEKLRD